jgi:hypothetical protein
VVVLVGAGLLVRSLQRLLSVDKGFEAGGLTSFVLNVASSTRRPRAPPRPRRRCARSARSPGCCRPSRPPPSARNGTARATRFEVEGRPAGDDDSAYFVGATPGYFEALGTRVLEGRAFTDNDRARLAARRG